MARALTTGPLPKPKGPARAKELERYSSIADHCSYTRDIWRDHTMHARRRFNEYEAQRAFVRISEFMVVLAELKI